MSNRLEGGRGPARLRELRNGIGALFLAGLAAATAPAAPAPAPGEPDLAAVRAATDRYRDIKVALAEGFVRDPDNLCLTAPDVGKPAALGAMGVHYFRPDLLGISGPPNPRVDGNGTHTDFLKPGVLIYEPQPDGSMQLVAVENLVFRKAWHERHPDRPTFHGLAYEMMEDNPATPADEGHKFTPHYDRHVWLYRDNPNGVFAPFNPNVTCAHHRGGEGGHHGG